MKRKSKKNGLSFNKYAVLELNELKVIKGGLNTIGNGGNPGGGGPDVGGGDTPVIFVTIRTKVD